VVVAGAREVGGGDVLGAAVVAASVVELLVGALGVVVGTREVGGGDVLGAAVVAASVVELLVGALGVVVGTREVVGGDVLGAAVVSVLLEDEGGGGVLVVGVGAIVLAHRPLSGPISPAGHGSQLTPDRQQLRTEAALNSLMFLNCTRLRSRLHPVPRSHEVQRPDG